jgi:hypothetical protein
MTRLIRPLLLVFVLLPLSTPNSWATVIGFEDGTNGAEVSGQYAALGVVMPKWKFHDKTVAGNNPFPFIDKWGVVPTGDGTAPEVRFAQPILGLTVDGFLQADEFGALRQWTLTAYDTSNAVLGSVSGTIIGLGSPIPGTFHTFLPSSLSLSLDGIKRVEITHGGPVEPIGAKFGIDTLLFIPDPDLAPAPVPEPTTLLLWGGAAGVGMVRWFTRRRSG